MKAYRAHIIPQRPAFGDRGWSCTVYAKTKMEARRRARDEAFQQCAYDRLDGALEITIEEENDNG